MGTLLCFVVYIAFMFLILDKLSSIGMNPITDFVCNPLETLFRHSLNEDKLVL